MLKTVFIGNKPTYDFFQKVKSDWDWQTFVPRIDDGRDQNGNVVYAGNGKPAQPGFWTLIDDGTLDADNTNIIIVSDEFYQIAVNNRSQDMMEDFLGLVYECSQSALTIIANYIPANRAGIEANLMKYAGRQENGSLQKYYWLSASSPLPDLDSAIKQYINSPDSDADNVRMICESEHLSPASTQSEQAYDMGDSMMGATSSSDTRYSNNYGKKAQIVCVTSSKGGVGKTTTTFGLASWLTASSMEAVKQRILPKPLKICVVDLDVHDAQIGSMIGKSDPTILKIAIEPIITPELIEKNLCYSERMKCHFLLSPKLPTASDTIPISKFEETIECLRYMFDVIILDTSVDYTDSLFSKVAYPKATRILFVTTLDRKAIIGMGKWIISNGQPESAGGANIPMNKVSVAINMGMRGVNMTVKEINKLIDVSMSKVYQTLDPNVSPEDYDKPQLIGAVPEIPNGIIMRLSNIQQFELALGIPPFEHSIGQIARSVMPEAFRDKLPDVIKNEK